MNFDTARMRFGNTLLVLSLLVHAPASLAALELTNAERITLDNGLTVLLLEDRNFPVVSVQMLYKVGARNEVTGKTGLAHFLEHMAFRATEKFPDTEVVSRIYGQGGEWHGYTWIDQTTYFATAPRDDLELLLTIEAERMGKLVIDPAYIEPEQGAVLAEMHMYENDPTSMLFDALLYTSFLAHPYRNNTIGWEEDIENTTHADAVDFYKEHYHPANGVLAVVGDFDKPQALATIARLFGALERRPATPLPHTVEPPQLGERRVGVTGAAAGKRFAIAYRAPAATHADFAAFLVLQEIIAGGSGVSFLQNDWGTPAKDASLLHGVAADLTTWFPPSAQNYVFVIGGALDDASAESDVEERIESRIATLRKQAPTAERLEAAVSAILDELIYDVQTTEDAAHQLAYFEGIDAFDLLLTLPQHIQRVTTDDVARVARSYLQPQQRTISWYRPAAEPQAPETSAASTTTIARPAGGPADALPVQAAELRRLSKGVPAIVRASDLSSSVSLKVVVRGTGLTSGDFSANDPQPGALSWDGRGRPADLAALAAAASAALAGATQAEPEARPQSTHPETRLQEEFHALMTAPQANTGAAALPTAIVVAGDVDTNRAFAILEKQFGDFNAAEPATAAPKPSPTGRKPVRLGRPIAQSQLGYIVAAPGPADGNYLAWQLLQYIVAHGYEGRLGKEAISRRGLAYYIDARYSSDGGPGWSTLAIGVDTHKLDTLDALLQSEFARLRAAPPTQAEVDEAKRHLLGRAISAAQSNDELVSSLATHWLRHGALPSIDTLREQLDGVKLEDVQALVPAFANGLTVTVSP